MIHLSRLEQLEAIDKKIQEQQTVGKSAKLKYKEISIGDSINYQWVTQTYGRAEFDFCPVFKYKHLKQLFIVRRQQPVDDRGYVLNIDPDLRINSIWISSRCGKDSANHWMNYWCKEHKCLAQEWYYHTAKGSSPHCIYISEKCFNERVWTDNYGKFVDGTWYKIITD